MTFGYAFIWPHGENPSLLLPNGKVCPLNTKGAQSHTFALGHPRIGSRRQPTLDVVRVYERRSRCRLAGNVRTGYPETPSVPEAPSLGLPVPEQAEESVDAPGDVGIEALLTEQDAGEKMLDAPRRSLREEAAGLYHQLRHKPKNTY